jgi:hypothetical protein
MNKYAPSPFHKSPPIAIVAHEVDFQGDSRHNCHGEEDNREHIFVLEHCPQSYHTIAGPSQRHTFRRVTGVTKR